MTTFKVRVQSYEDAIAEVEARIAAVAAGKVVNVDSTYTFPSWKALHRTLAPNRINILRAMAGQGPMSVRDVARAVGRDVKNVHTDLGMLAMNGVIDKTGDGVVFSYDRIHVEFDIDVAA